MVEKNDLPSDKDQELEKLIADYEAARKENRSLYLDEDQFVDIVSRYITEKSFDKAQEAIDYGLKLHPGNVDLMMEQAYLYMFAMEYSKAKSVADSIAYADPTKVKILKAQIAQSEGNTDEVETLLESIEDKESLGTILDVSSLYIGMNKYEKALQWLTPYIENYQEDVSFLETIATCYYKTKQGKQAICFYNKLIDKNPYEPVYWSYLAQLYFNQLRLDKVIEACDFAIAIDEKLGDPHLLKAYALYHLDNSEKAIFEFQQAFKYEKSLSGSHYLFMGFAYTDLQKWEEAIQCYDLALKAIEDKSTSLVKYLYRNKATALFELGRYKEAHQVFETTKREYPQDEMFYLLEGSLYNKEQKYDKAKECWDIAIHHAPTADTWREIGDCHIDSGLIADARACFEEVQKLDPEYPDINLHLTVLCLLQQDVEGFQKYNQLMEHPLTEENVQKVFAYQIPPIIGNDIFNEFIQDIAKIIKKGNNNMNIKTNEDLYDIF